MIKCVLYDIVLKVQLKEKIVQDVKNSTTELWEKYFITSPFIDLPGTWLQMKIQSSQPRSLFKKIINCSIKGRV